MEPNNQSQVPNQPPNPTPPTDPYTHMPDDELQKVDNPLGVMQPGERVICHIKRHPFGLFGIYFLSALVLIIVFTAAALAPHYISGLTDRYKVDIFVGAVFVAIITLLYMYIASIIYNGNRWIVTSDSITQVTQTGLFNKQSSQLSLGNLEDVTFEQESIIQSLFGFGTLHVETAGERSKFVFPFCPTPQKCATEIIQAHEQYMTVNPEGAYRDGQGISRPGGIDVNA